MTTTTTALPPPVQQKFDAKLLARPMQKNIHNTFAMQKEMDEHVGSTLRMRRYTNLQQFPVPLGPNFLNPPTQVLSAVDIDAIVQFYATSVLITKQVTLINEDPVLNETVSLLSQSLRDTEDTLIKTMLSSTASFVNASGGTNGDVPTNLSRIDIEQVVQALLTADGDYITNQIDAEDKYGTSPVFDAFFGMASTRLLPQLRQIDGWIDKAQYPSPGQTLSAEVGSVSNVRCVLSSGGVVVPNGSAAGADVYKLFVTAQQAYTTIKQNGFTAKFMYVPPTPSSADPAGLRQYGSCRFAQANVITNQAWIISLNSTLSYTPV